MDINDLQQLNNFADGMNTDTSDFVLSESSYRLANNLRFITNEQENSGELHMIEGAVLTKQFGSETIIGTTSLRDIPIYITTDGNRWKVYYGDQLVANIPAEDNRVIGHTLSLVTRYESDDNKKLYIADGAGPVLCIQLHVEYGNYASTLHDVESVPAVLFKKPIFCGLIGGNIKAAVVEYSYQFYKKHGQQSEISPSTKLIPLFKGETTAKESSKILGYLPDEQPDKGVKIIIPYDQSTISPFDRIKIFRISYIETGQLPQIECVYDENIDTSSSQIIFEDTGQTALSVYSLEEYNAMTGIHIIPKTIESKDDYLFAANVKDDSTGFDIGNWKPDGNIELSQVTVDLIGDNTDDPSYVVQKPQHKILTTPRPHIIVTEINQKKLTSTIQTSDDVFDLSDYIDTHYIDDNGITWDGRDVLSYHNPQVSYMFKSLRRGETYRFGIIFYDKKGRSSGVIHLQDVKIDQDDFFEIKDHQLIVKPKGLKFNITGSLPIGTVAYEIVRCGRSIFDMSTITQGFLSRPIRREYNNSKVREVYPLTPTGFISLHDMRISNNDPDVYKFATNEYLEDDYTPFKGNRNIFQFISPEICYDGDSMKDILSKYELTLEPVKHACPYIFSLEQLPDPQEAGFIDGYSYMDGAVNPTWTTSRPRYCYGNKYANIIYHIHKESMIHIVGQDSLLTDYLSSDKQYIDLQGSADFKENIAGDQETRYAYAKLYYDYQGQMPNIIGNEYKVSSIGFPETLNWNDFAKPSADKLELLYVDKISNVGGANFVNWVCGQLYGSTDQTVAPDKIDINKLGDGSYQGIATMGPGGKCIVLDVDDKNYDIVSSIPQTSLINTYICNLKRKCEFSNTDISRKNSLYRSFGDYFPATKNTCYIFNGDCFIHPFEYVAIHKFSHSSSRYWRTACRIFVVPLETSINLAYTSGYEFAKEFNNSSGDISYIQNDISNVNNLFIQNRPLYSYNTVYSTIDTSRTFSSRESIIDTDESDLSTDCRVFHSNVKTNNEYIDNWLKYMPANFLDVDTRKGPITGLRTFKNQLVFWQEYAAGVLSVNERSVISDDSNMPLILGSGGVLTRFDYFTNVNGMHKDDYSDAQSNTTLYWWDRANKSIVGYSGGQDAIELSKIKFVQNYLNKNEPTAKPVVAYDNKTKEVVANVVDGNDHEKGSLVYNEHLGHFTSLYTIKPKYKVELSNTTLFTTDKFVYEWNKFNGSKVYGFGEEIYPYLKHVVNHAGQYTKVFDNAEFAGRVYGGDKSSNPNKNAFEQLTFRFTTPLKQEATLKGKDNVENREYNFRYIIPRNDNAEYGDRLRGKTMQCELESKNNSYDFSLQYIKTKFRISWS